MIFPFSHPPLSLILPLSVDQVKFDSLLEKETQPHHEPVS